MYLPCPVYTLSKAENLPVNLIYGISERRVLWGFEKRFPPFYKKDPTFRPSYTSFGKVEDSIWFGPPHSSEIFIYDLEGRPIKKIWPGIPDGLALDDYQGTTDFDGFMKVWRSKIGNSRIFYVKPIVLATFMGKSSLHERMNIFDSSGNILLANLRNNNNVLFSELLEGHGDHIFGVVDIDFFRKSAIDSLLTAEQKAMFVNAGWNEEQAGDAEDNAYLVFYKVSL